MTEHRIDVLISRIVDRVETPAEWLEFRAIGTTDSTVWEMLAEAQRDHEKLSALAREAVSFADRVALPAGPNLHVAGDSTRRRSFWSGAGWAAAASLLLAWIATGRIGVTPADRVQTAGPALATASPDEAFQHYVQRGMDSGVVVGELDNKILLNTQPLDNGAYEVIFVRQVVERREVPTIVQFRGVDESGKPHPHFIRSTVRDAM
ncbi:MAG: hypothetical protein JNM94_12920 [Phycisphaerae bacterium]|nr:hypothetical protein [Phycisphaerae bacterium]